MVANMMVNGNIISDVAMEFKLLEMVTSTGANSEMGLPMVEANSQSWILLEKVISSLRLSQALSSKVNHLVCVSYRKVPNKSLLFTKKVSRLPRTMKLDMSAKILLFVLFQ